MTSHRQIFRSSAIIGGASAINIAVGIIKVKVLAVMLGPSGVGLMGFFQNIVSAASTMAGCGMNRSGIRQLAASVDEPGTLSNVRRALWLGSLILGMLGMAILWTLREPVAQWIFGNTTHAWQVGWLCLGIPLTLLAGSQTALLQGLRRTGDYARVSISSSIAGAAAGVLAVHQLGEDGVLWFVLTAPAVSVLIAGYYASRLPKIKTPHDWSAFKQQWGALLRLGIPLMTASLMTLITQLVARSIILRELGLDASGHFQAAWVISMTYIGFVLGAMSTDYFPRLTAAITDHEHARQLVNEQTEMALLLAGPVLLAMTTLAPLVIRLLYAESFIPASNVLRWQALGDILRLVILPMSFIVLAKGRGIFFVGTHFIWDITYLGILALGIHEWGLLAAGIGFWLACLVYYAVIALLSKKMIGFSHTQRNKFLALSLLIMSGLIIFLSGLSPTLGYASGLLATLASVIYCSYRLDQLVDIRGWLRRKSWLR